MAAVIRITDVGSDLKLKRPEKGVNEKAKCSNCYKQGSCQRVFSGSAFEERPSAPNYQHYHGCLNDYSINQPVLNCSIIPSSIKSRIPNVM